MRASKLVIRRSDGKFFLWWRNGRAVFSFDRATFYFYFDPDDFSRLRKDLFDLLTRNHSVSPFLGDLKVVDGDYVIEVSDDVFDLRTL